MIKPKQKFRTTPGAGPTVIRVAPDETWLATSCPRAPGCSSHGCTRYRSLAIIIGRGRLVSRGSNHQSVDFSRS